MRPISVGADQSTWKNVITSERRSRLLVLVPCPPCQRRTIRGLPPVPRPTLRDIVNSNVQRFFPLAQSALVTDVAWLGGKGAARSARAYAITETLSLQILDIATSAGCEVVDIRPTDEATTYSLLPRVEVERRRRADVKRTAMLTLVTVGVILGALIMATAGQRLLRLAAERSQPPVEVLRTAKKVQDDVRAALRAESAFVNDRARNQRLIALLLTVVRALDQRDELTTLELANVEVRELSVVSPDPEHLLSALGRTSMTKKLQARDGPTLVRRGDEVWTHLLLRPDESSR